MELYMKAGPEGVVGDCPFAHYVGCVLRHKGLKYEAIPCTVESKPDWLLNDSKLQGKMPCLKDGDVKVVESSDIAAYLEKTYGDPSLSNVDDLPGAMSVGSKIFPALARLLKHPGFSQEKEDNLVEAVEVLEEHLKNGRKYLAGSISLADYSLAPKLFHMKVTLKNYYPSTRGKLEDKFPSVEKYMSRMFEEKAFLESNCEERVVICGWDVARGSGGGCKI